MTNQSNSIKDFGKLDILSLGLALISPRLLPFLATKWQLQESAAFLSKTHTSIIALYFFQAFHTQLHSLTCQLTQKSWLLLDRGFASLAAKAVAVAVAWPTSSGASRYLLQVTNCAWILQVTLLTLMISANETWKQSVLFGTFHHLRCFFVFVHTWATIKTSHRKLSF